MKNNLTDEQLEELANKLDNIRLEVKKSLGQEDIEFIQNLMSKMTSLRVSGRTLLHAGIDPLTFLLGVLCLGVSKSMEWVNIGHSVYHGQYNFANIDEISSTHFKWAIPTPRHHWLSSHNIKHHQNTGILGKDHDLGIRSFGVGEKNWTPLSLLEPFRHFYHHFTFLHTLSTHDLERISIDNFWYKTNNENELRKRKEILECVKRDLLTDFVFFPLLSGINAPRVFLGNFIANSICSSIVYTSTLVNHFPDGVELFTEEETKDETKGQKYLRQILASANIEPSKFVNFFTGYLSYQIEHHLFPEIPNNRLPEVSEKIKPILKEYNIQYNTGSYTKQYLNCIKKITLNTLPINLEMKNHLQPFTEDQLKHIRKLFNFINFYFSPMLFGIEKLKLNEKPAMLVGNHSVYAFDAFIMGIALLHHHDIRLRFLMDNILNEAPVLNKFLKLFGGAVASKETCKVLMDTKQTIVVFPGGSREACKNKDEINKLIWKDRVGFIKTAIENEYDIIPFGCIGSDESYNILYDGNDLKNSKLWAILNKYTKIHELTRNGEMILPFSTGIGFTNIPKPQKHYYHFGERLSTLELKDILNDKTKLLEVRSNIEYSINTSISELIEFRKKDKLNWNIFRRYFTL